MSLYWSSAPYSCTGERRWGAVHLWSWQQTNVKIGFMLRPRCSWVNISVYRRNIRRTEPQRWHVTAVSEEIPYTNQKSVALWAMQHYSTSTLKNPALATLQTHNSYHQYDKIERLIQLTIKTDCARSCCDEMRRAEEYLTKLNVRRDGTFSIIN